MAICSMLSRSTGNEAKEWKKRNIKSDITILGSPAQEANKMRKIYVYERKLEDMEKRISELEKQLKQAKH